MDFSITAGPAAAIMGEALQCSQQGGGLALSNAGDHEASERMHQRALDLKIQAKGIDSTEAGVSRNAVGEEQLELGKLDQAEETLREAVRVREAAGPAHAFDAAVSRENLARVFEAKGQWAPARETRTRKENEMVCSNYRCPGQMFTKSQLKQCGRCRAAFYCTPNCQVADYKKRHKKLCTPVADQAQA